MPKDTINLADTLEIFKKNLKAFYIFVFSGILVGLIGIVSNVSYIEEKSNITLKISINNPLKNYFVLDLFTLDRVFIDEKGVSVSTTSQKIKNFYEISEEYLELLIQTLDLSDYNIFDDQEDYNLNSKKIKRGYVIEINNVLKGEKVLKNLSNLREEINSLITPVIMNNIKKETEHIEDYYNNIRGGSSPHLFTMIELRKDTLKNLGDKRIDLFEVSISEKKTKVKNAQIMIFTILTSLSIFLLFLILKR